MGPPLPDPPIVFVVIFLSVPIGYPTDFPSTYLDDVSSGGKNIFVVFGTIFVSVVPSAQPL